MDSFNYGRLLDSSWELFLQSRNFFCVRIIDTAIFGQIGPSFPGFSSVICNTILKASLNTSTLLSRIPGLLIFAFAIHRCCKNYTFLSWNIAEINLFSKRRFRYSKINIVRQWHELWCNLNIIFSLNSMGISYNTNITKNLLNINTCIIKSKVVILTFLSILKFFINYYFLYYQIAHLLE